MNNIDVSISYGFGPDNRYKLSNTPESIQLAIYKYSIYESMRDEMISEIHTGNINVNAVHLPLDTLKTEPSKIMVMIEDLMAETNCKKYVIHPNKNIERFVDHFIPFSPKDTILCIENFQWKRKKVFRSPLQTIEFIHYLRHSYGYENVYNKLRLCFDTSHAEDIWFDYKIMSHLLNYIDVIHLSNRKGKSQHMPFNSDGCDLNLVGFIKELISRYKWYGDIVLEYMPEYHHRLVPNAQYIKKLINERSIKKDRK